MKFFDYGENGPAVFTGLSTGSWNRNVDLDLDATYVGNAPTIPATATGVILRFVAGITDREVGAQHPDCTQDITDHVQGRNVGSWLECFTGINSSHEIDLYIEDSSVTVYLIGYFDAEADFESFLSSGSYVYTWSNSASGWETEDLSAYLSASAKFAIIQIDSQSIGGNYGYNFREPSDTHTRQPTYAQEFAGAIIPVDGSGNVECWVENANTDFYLVGEITDGTVRDQGVDVSLGTTGSYQDVDFSGDSPPAGSAGAIVEIYQSTATQVGWMRYDDTSNYPDLYHDGFRLGWVVMPMLDIDDSENERCKAKIEDAGTDFYVWGYLPEDAVDGALTVNVSDSFTAAEALD